MNLQLKNDWQIKISPAVNVLDRLVFVLGNLKKKTWTNKTLLELSCSQPNTVANTIQPIFYTVYFSGLDSCLSGAFFPSEY